MATIDERVTKLENRMDAVEATLARIAVVNEDTDRRLNNLTQRIDSFVRESSRIFGDHGERISRIEAAIESLVGAVQTTARNVDRLERSQQTTNQNLEQLIQAVNQQGVRLDTLINRIVDPDEN